MGTGLSQWESNPRKKVRQGYSREYRSPWKAEEHRVGDWDQGGAFGKMPPVIFMPGIRMGTAVEISELR